MILPSSSPRTTGSRKKVTLAVLDESTAAQLRESLAGDNDLELVWAGTSIDALRAARPRAQVLLADISYLGENPSEVMDELVRLTGAELGIALYAFAKRALLDSISSGRVRTIRAPLNVPMLRCQMMGLIARNLLAGPSDSPALEIRPPRYSMSDLGKLQQISTAVDCECPTHLSVLLQNLVDFEDYSKNCESRNDADAQIHRLLYEHTAKARLLLETAMDKLIAHENIEL